MQCKQQTADRPQRGPGQGGYKMQKIESIKTEIRTINRQITICENNIESARKELTQTITNGTIQDIATFGKNLIDKIERNLNDIIKHTEKRELLEFIISDAE